MKNITIEIVSGEGNAGTAEAYTGARTASAIRAQLTRERAGGDRWAFVRIDGKRVHDRQYDDLENALPPAVEAAS